jgi:A/G-specific adenine glycosylase
MDFQQLCREMLNPSTSLLNWYALEARDLPWRLTRDPYKIWLSEVILQQTRIDQGTSYYHRFIKRFPTVDELAATDTDTLMKYWEGLGYYSRARNLHHTAKVIVQDYGSQFPDTYQSLMQLKGIGPYTARAVGSFAFNNVVGVLDGNVFRVLSRYMADFSPIDLPQTRKDFQAQLDAWISQATTATGDVELSSKFNQAMMDLGATICSPRKPQCQSCPLAQACQGYQKDLAEQLPVKAKKLARKTVYFHFFLAGPSSNLWVLRRPATGLWPNLWEIPNMEVDAAEWQHGDLEGYTLLGAFKHVFTHLDMMIKVYQGPDIQLWRQHTEDTVQDGAKLIARTEIGDYAFSRAVLKIFEQYL